MIDLDNNSQIEDLATKLMSQATLRGITLNSANSIIEIENATLEYYKYRHYDPTDEEPFEPIYAGTILKLAISSICKIGAEGETMHTEGSITRMYGNGGDYPIDIVRSITPLVKGID